MKLKIHWHIFYEQCKADIRFWCFFILLQQLGRACFIGVLANNLAPETRITTIVYAMMHGLRFDSVWTTCWLLISLTFFTLPTLFTSAINQNTLHQCRRYLGCVFTVTTAFIYIASIEYYLEYKDVFNQFLFNWFYDDKVAILKTIYKGHHIILNLTIMVATILIYLRLSHYIGRNTTSIKKPKPEHSATYKIIASLIIVVFCVVGFRGSFGSRPVQLKDAGVTIDPFLNKAIASPYSSLKYAIGDYQTIKAASKNGGNLSFHEVQKIAQKFFDTDKQYTTLAQYLKKTANGSTLPKPKHIFLIVGESLDAWPLQNEYIKFNLDSNLHKLIANGAIYFKYFLPCATGTMETLNTLMAGVPDEDLHINYRANHHFSTALATQFKRLGYKTQFFYGGYLSWQRVGDFANTQGFSSVYGAAHIKSWKQTNEWGVDDRTLFNFIIDKVKADNVPTFNVIMTTSNHPPFSINLDQEGFDKEKAKQLLAQYPKSNTNVNELGHIWYADKTIGEFVNEITVLDPSTIVAITGDHYGRRHILTHAPLFETSAVPLIIYGPNVSKYCRSHNCNQQNSIAGSHIDLAATLIELVAPKGFTYHSLGNNLLAQQKFNVGIGKEKIITQDFIASTDNKDIIYFNQPKLATTQATVQKQVGTLLDRLRESQGLARYIIEKGDGSTLENKD